jgi:Galactose mutarotase and related enzymes
MQKMLNYGKVFGIVDTVGGELISYKNNDREYIWSGMAEYWTGHAPVLFPIVGALKDNKIAIDGGDYSMNKHGFARKSEFALTKLTDNKAVFELTYNEETLKQYPYKFKLVITHEIDDKGFSTEYKVQNLDSKPIMFAIGGHTGFAVDSIEDYKLVFDQTENCKLYYTDKDSIISDNFVHAKSLDNTNEFELYYADYDIDVIIAKDLKSRKVKLVHKTNGRGVEFDYSGFDVLGIWTPPGKKAPFICLEPWNGIPAYDTENGTFANKPYIVTVDKDNSYKVGYKVKIV